MISFPIQYSKFQILAILVVAAVLTSCNKEEPFNPPEPTDYRYVAQITSPTENSIYSFGDTIPITANFISETGEIVHYISVEIFDEDDQSISMYAVEAHQHVSEEFLYEDSYVIKGSAALSSSPNWVIRASMWSHELEPDTISEFVKFQVD